MNNQSGFTIIELLIASLIAALITSLLFAAYWQINKTTARFDNYVDIHYKAMLLQRVLERDLSGAFVPLSVFEYEKQQKEKTGQPGQEKESKLPKIDKVFYATTKDNQLDLLTCITNNPLPSYWSEQLGKPKPAIARVVYRLLPDPADKRFFSLWRQESTQLSFDAYKAGGAINSYQVVSELKSLAFSFSSFEENEGAQKKKIIEKKTSSDWNREDNQARGDKKQKRIPQLVTARAVLADKRSSRTLIYEFYFAIMTDSALPENPPQAAQPVEKNQQKTNQPIQQNKQNSPVKNAFQLLPVQSKPTIVYNGHARDATINELAKEQLR